METSLVARAVKGLSVYLRPRPLMMKCSHEKHNSQAIRTGEAINPLDLFA